MSDLTHLPSEADELSSLFSEVLLVEDEETHAKLIKRALNGVVGEVRHVSNGQEALQAIATSLPELVLCDLHLPGISGMEILEAIKSVRPGLPFIVMTGSSKIDDAVAAMRAGAWDYMVKEFSTDFRERVHLVVQRIAERKIREMRELQVRAERDAFSQAVRAAQDGVAILEQSGAVVFANEAFHKFVERAQPQQRTSVAEGLNVLDVLGLQDSAVAEQFRSQLLSDASSSGTMWRTEVKVTIPGNKEAQYFELMLTSFRLGEHRAPRQSFDGLTLQRYVVWVRNISERKAQERFQRDILSTTSHDLKGPLGAIATSAELLESGVERADTKSHELITRIGSCARNCISLIDELLSARRIQDGVMVIKPRLYDVAEILDDLVLDYLPLAKAKSIRLSNRPLSELVEIYADRMGLQRVLGNLVSNAIKFTPNGGEVELAAVKRPGEVMISVADTGPGIESEARHQLFERYSRLEKHQEVDGSGLGLFVTKSIVDAHDGRIEVMSEIGRGTTFSVVFPDAP